MTKKKRTSPEKEPDYSILGSHRPIVIYFKDVASGATLSNKATGEIYSITFNLDEEKIREKFPLIRRAIVEALEDAPADETMHALKLNDAGIRDWRLIAEHSNPAFQFLIPEQQDVFIKRLAKNVAQKRRQLKKTAISATTEEKKGRTKKINSTGQKHQIDE